MPNVVEWAFRRWYWYVNTVDKDAEILFMNYGYSNGEEITLESHEEANRYSIQLYHLLADSVDLKDKHLVEIGCGRGGGLAYVKRNFELASARGIDLNKTAIKFSNDFYDEPNLTFHHGDAQNIPFESDSCDAVLNVESSHRYPEIHLFFSEVYRILRPGGHLLYTDFRPCNEVEEWRKKMEDSGLELMDEQDITAEVVTALELDHPRRKALVKKLTPFFLHQTALNFAGGIGSKTYKRFQKRKWVYMNYVLRKG